MMQLKFRSVVLLPALAAGLLLSSCHSVPKQARLIPKDALLVLGVHTGELRKEIAWSAVTGSSMLDELRRNGIGDKVPDMLKDMESAGIDFSSTLYVYTKADNRYSSKMRVGGILPVADASKVSAYIAKHFPGKQVRSGAKGIHELMPDSSAVVAWNDDVLMVMNSISQAIPHSEPARIDTIGGAPVAGEPYSWTEYVPDEAATYAEVDAAFSLPKESSIAGNERFRAVEGAGHDITMFLAYDAMMDLAGTSGGIGLAGLGMSNALWKNAAVTAGFNFAKGAVDGLLRYYPADSMKSVAQAFSKDNIDADMLRRLPAGGLNLALGYHITPAAVKAMLDRLSLSGGVNMVLAQKGLSMDDVLGAFSGDIALALNNFRTETKTQQVDSAMQELYGLKPYPVTSPELDYIVGLKIGDKAKLGKLLNFVSVSGMMQQIAPNVYTFPNTTDGPVLVAGDQYIVIARTAAAAQAFVGQSSGSMPDAARDAIKGHPVGMWADVRGFINGASEMTKNSPSDSAMYNVVRGMFSTLTVSGGEWRGGANEYKMRLSFQNSEENSLLQIWNMAQRLTTASRQGSPNL